MTSPRKSRDPKTLRPATQLDPRRLDAVAASRRRRKRSVPDPGLSLRHDGARRGALQGRRPGLHLFALRQSDRCDVRAADGAARGRRGGARDGERHGGGNRLAHGPAQGGRPYRRRAGSVRLVPLCGRGAAAALRRRLDPGRRRRPRRVAGGAAARTPRRRSSNRRPIRRSRSSTSPASPRSCMGRRNSGRRQRLRHAAAAASDEARRRLRRLFGDQAHRRPGARARRDHPGVRKVHRRPHSQFPAPDGSLSLAVQRLDASEVARDPAGARRGADPLRREDRRLPQPIIPRSCATLYPGRADHPQAALAQAADGGRRHDGVVRSRRRQGGGVPGRQRAHRSSASRTISATPRASSPIRRRRPTSGSSPSSARRSASPRACCGCRSASRTSTT